MKTNRIVVIVTALSLAAASSLWAAPRGKHVSGEPFPHRHGVTSGSATVGSHTVLKRVGPPGKGYVRSFSHSR
jgi:hypothetical protein